MRDEPIIRIVRERSWRAIATFAYRRWCRAAGPERRPPVGVPGNRDPDNPCDGYAPRPWMPGDYKDCQTDGHYLCRLCCHREESDTPEPPARLAE